MDTSWPSKGGPGQRLEWRRSRSFVAGTLSLIGLTVCAPLLAGVALAFGPPEYFALMVMSLLLAVSLSDRALFKGAVALVIGILTATIGLDPSPG